MNNIIKNLSRYCNFADTFKHNDETRHPVSEMGYIRGDHDGRQWWTNPFTIHPELNTPERARELDAVCDAFVDTFPNLRSLEAFCIENAEDLRHDNEYNLYYEGSECNYWIRVIIRQRDYNLYIHAYVKEKDVMV
jgi:hypothetical protein